MTQARVDKRRGAKQKRRTPSERLRHGIAVGVWTLGGLLAATALAVSNEFTVRSFGQFIGVSVVWGLMTGIFSLPMLLAARLVSAPVARRLDVQYTRRLLGDLRARGGDVPQPSTGLVARWKQWRRRARLNRWLRRGGTAWMIGVPILMAASSGFFDALGMMDSSSMQTVIIGSGLLVWLTGFVGLWSSRHRPEVGADELEGLLEASGVPTAVTRRVRIEVGHEDVRVEAKTAAPVSAEPVTVATITSALHSEPTGDASFDEATRVVVDDVGQAPLQAWMTADVRAALAWLLADGGRLDRGVLKGAYDLTDEDDVQAFVTGVVAASRSADALNGRAVFSARDRVLDAASRAGSPAEVKALVDGVRRHVSPSEVSWTADWWAAGVRGPARTFALDLAMDRGQRIALAMQIDADVTEHSAVRGAALGDALELRSHVAVTRLHEALHAGDAWRVVEAAAGCDVPVADDVAVDVAGAALASSLPAPVIAAVIARVARSISPAAVEALGERVVATRAAPLTVEARAARLLADQSWSVVLQRAGEALVSRIAASQQGALALTQAEGVAGGLAVAQPAAEWRESAVAARGQDAVVDRAAEAEAEVEQAVAAR